MFNPFAQFMPQYLPAFKEKGVKAFVRQTYERGKDLLKSDPQPSYILNHFSDANKAREHYNAIDTDPNRRIYFTEDKQDWEQLTVLLNNTSSQLCYTILVVKDVNEKARKCLETHIRSYIHSKTDWQPASYARISFSLEFVFGEIYVLLIYGPRKIRMKLDELEEPQPE
jgi:hypothetical protein